MIVQLEYDQDHRHGWASINVGDSTSELIIIRSDNGSYGFTFDGENMIPTCTCSAWSSSVCCCNNVRWDDYE